ncbi:long-chain-fatty-acid--CoA ligase [Actinospica robiniae]|uniref:long-chain-fatty-acid--CoA ligase n=1 Tax=Actinospica robiniae TaxID=304901 RepID=UPI000429D5EF|nr:long-chain fatty acid--CoA ligase [Actinospica robiniae]
MTLSLAAVLAEPAWRTPDKTAVIQGAEALSYAELWEQARAQAAALIGLGVQPGDRVALMAPNVLDFPRTYYAVLAAGGVVVPVHMLLTPEEISYILRDSGAKVLIAHAIRAEDAIKAAALAEIPVRIVGPVPAEAPVPKLADDVAGVKPLQTYISRMPEDPCVVIYTSGTTGKPKGAVLTNLNMVMNATINGFDCLNTLKSDISLGCLPLFHIFGQTVSMNTIFRVGATVVFQPRFEPDEAIELMLEHGVNTFHGVPQMYLALVQAAKQRKAAGRERLPQLKIAVSGGASLPAAVLEAFNEIFDADVLEGYGLSETSPTATVNQPALGTRAGTVGHAVWGVEVEIAKAEVEGRIELVERGELGEVVIRGHNVFAGYLGNDEATAAAICDGWFRTGDLGTKSADGFVSIVDRKKDMVLRGGFNVYPREVEETLLRHPAVRDVAVIGLADEVHGEEICACVILQDGHELTAEELISWSKEYLAKYKYPRRVEFLTEFPLGPSMKVLKRELRDRFS